MFPQFQEFIGKRRMNRWFGIRLAIVALAATSGLDGTASSASPEGIDWRTYLGLCGIVFAVVMIGGFCAIGGSYQTKGVSAGWNKPSWDQNPFSFRSQPLQGAHLLYFCAIAAGVSGVLRELWTGRYGDGPQPGIALAFGLGAWIALRVAVMIFHPKQINQPSSPKQQRPKSNPIFKLLFIVLITAIGVTNIVRFEYRTKGRVSLTGVLCVAAWTISCALFFLYARRRLGR